MKYKTVVVIVSLLLAATVAIGSARYISTDKSSNDKIKIVATFYPVYIAAKNITKDIDGIELVCLTESNVGCVHDFQLRPQDMVLLEGADMLLTNGAGMESFLTEIAAQYPSLVTVDSSKNIPLLPAASSSLHLESISHDHEHEDTGSYNPHIWLSPSRYLKQVDNLCSAIAAQFPQYAEQMQKNTDHYKTQIQALQADMEAALANIKNRDVILFHDSFAYFADDFGLHVADIIPMESDTALSAGDIAQVIDVIQSSGIQVLFAEAQYSTALADAIAKETDASVYILDTCVTGPMEETAYLEGMRKNLDVLCSALT